jgi:hypothetical protein
MPDQGGPFSTKGVDMTYMFQTQYTGTDPSMLIDNMGMFNELVKESGSSGMVLLQAIAAGEMTGTCIAVSFWDSVQAGWDGLSSLYADPRVQALAENPAMSAVGRNVAKEELVHGNCSGGYAGITIFSGDLPNANEFANISSIADANGVNGIRISQALAAGANSGSRAATFYCDSLDNWADTMGALASDPAFKIGGARTGFTPMGRMLVVVH